MGKNDNNLESRRIFRTNNKSTYLDFRREIEAALGLMGRIN